MKQIETGLLAVLSELLDKIHKLNYPNNLTLRNWQIERVNGGRNNLMYRAQRNDLTFALKFYTSDQRDRIDREYYSLQCLRLAGLKIAPEPLLLDRNSYQYPILVETWLDGTTFLSLPSNDSEWMKLINHYVAIFKATSKSDLLKVVQAHLPIINSRKEIEKQFLLIPESKRSTFHKTLFQKMNSRSFPELKEFPLALLRCDPNPLNFLRLDEKIYSVDWENGGWGDQAFDIADLLSHPSYLAIDQVRRDWLVKTYADSISDHEASQRINIYYWQMIAWWVFRLSRELLNPSSNIVPRKANWQAEASANLKTYMALAENYWLRGKR